MLESRYLLASFAAACLLTAPTRAQMPTGLPPSGTDPEAYVKLGVEQGSHGDLSGAIADFDKAIKINPQWAPAYEKKGYALLLENKFDEAIANFNQAIQIDPTYQDAYYYRGTTEGAQTRFDTAIEDFSHVIQLNPEHSQSYLSRGVARYFKGDFHGTIADTTQALGLDPNLSNAHFTCGLARRALHDRQGQSSDFQKSADGGYPYGAFWFWLVTMEDGRQDEAKAKLADFFSNAGRSTSVWPRHIGDFLLGKLSRDDLLVLAGQDDPASGHTCEAWFFIGINDRVRGDLKGAQAAFLEAIATGAKQSVEYVEAQRELANLPKQ